MYILYLEMLFIYKQIGFSIGTSIGGNIYGSIRKACNCLTYIGPQKSLHLETWFI